MVGLAMPPLPGPRQQGTGGTVRGFCERTSRPGPPAGGGPQNPAPQMPTLVCGVEGCQAVSGKPITKESLCHASTIVSLVGLLTVPGVDIPVGVAWALYGTGAVTAVASVTVCW